MQRYLAIVFAIPLAGLALMMALNVLIDPFDVYRLISVPGFNAVKSMRDTEGGRVAISHALLRGGYRALVVGNSRIQAGFPQTVPAISGEFLNAGMAGLNARETARVLSLARHTPAFDCAFVSLDFESFDGADADTSSYDDSALPDGQRLRSMLAVALSTQTLRASILTLRTNAFGIAPKQPRILASNSPKQRARFVEAGQRLFDFHRTFVYDPQRLALLVKAADLMTRDGIQVIGFFPPVHAWDEELAWETGQGDAFLRFRRDAVSALQVFAARPARAACGSGGAVVLWDFAGYRGIGAAVPGDAGTGEHAAFYREAMHFAPVIGEAVLMRMLGRRAAIGIGETEIGEDITQGDPDRLEQELLKRRSTWLTSPAAADLKLLLPEWRRREAPAPLRPSPIGQADFDGL